MRYFTQSTYSARRRGNLPDAVEIVVVRAGLWKFYASRWSH